MSVTVPTTDELRDVHATQQLRPYLRELWQRRPYVWYEALSEVRSRQVDTVLGNLWQVLSPVLTVAIYYLIFALLLNINRGVDNVILFLSVGIFLFRLAQRTTTLGANSIVTNEGLIKTIRFPRVILPITSTTTALLEALSSFAVIYVVAVLTGEPLAPRWLAFVPVIAVFTLFNAGAAMVAARTTTHFRDTTQLLPFLFRLLLYGSGVIFNVSAYAEGDRWIEWLFTLNPLYCFITVGRWSLMGGDDVTAGILVSLMVWTIGILVGGFFWFRAAEHSYARD